MKFCELCFAARWFVRMRGVSLGIHEFQWSGSNNLPSISPRGGWEVWWSVANDGPSINPSERRTEGYIVRLRRESSAPNVFLCEGQTVHDVSPSTGSRRWSVYGDVTSGGERRKAPLVSRCWTSLLGATVSIWKNYPFKIEEHAILGIPIPKMIQTGIRTT